MLPEIQASPDHFRCCKIKKDLWSYQCRYLKKYSFSCLFDEGPGLSECGMSRQLDGGAEVHWSETPLDQSHRDNMCEAATDC